MARQRGQGPQQATLHLGSINGFSEPGGPGIRPDADPFFDTNAFATNVWPKRSGHPPGGHRPVSTSNFQQAWSTGGAPGRPTSFSSWGDTLALQPFRTLERFGAKLGAGQCPQWPRLQRWRFPIHWRCFQGSTSTRGPARLSAQASEHTWLQFGFLPRRDITDGVTT